MKSNVANRINIAIHTGKPGMVIGKGGSEIEKLRNKLNNLTDKKYTSTLSKSKIDIDARLREYCTSIRKPCFIPSCTKQAISRAMKLGAKGIKTQVSGRLGGVTLLVEQYSEGTVPLHTLRRHRLCTSEADTTYGKLGVKVWIYRGEVLPTKNTSEGGK